ncbi:hypothetical protein GCM10010277_55310 [Streptomyces longisporoflavus]|uniref:hypothetical protein n=1 Tax=Streptomyces longisporoflavus TaxID=28044 RepID=UPI0019896505|nr:hypothetical protein [Streptomyces longisporoflavus]GGV55319.1 hypothetical protein GCM10010277_55310 [Streptomyces longisporoflavus]
MSGHEHEHDYGRERDAREREERGRDALERDENAEFEQHAGDGTVKHGHGEQGDLGERDAAPGEQGGEPVESASAESEPAESESAESESASETTTASAFEGVFGGGGGGGGEESDELALRRMMRSAVQEIEPNDHALERLRHAVPARRARKRQAVVGMAAAALFIGTAIPALVHVTNSGSGADDRPSIAGNSEQTQGGSGEGKGPGGGEKGESSGSSPSKSKDKKDKKDKKDGKGKGAASDGATGGPDPAGTESADSPACAVDQLGNASGSAGPAEADGKVYGTFRIANVSGSTCTVSAAGSVSTSTTGAADPAKIGVVDHVAGDAATGLPDPSQAVSSLVLAPGAAYEVKFAWVPSEGCPTDSGEPSPDPSPTEGGGSEGGTPDNTVPQMVREDGGVVEGGVTVSLVAPEGSPAAGATITNACAGTVYRTGMLSAS